MKALNKCLETIKSASVALNPLFGAALIPANIVTSLPLHTMYLPLCHAAPCLVPLECFRLLHIFFFYAFSWFSNNDC